MNEAAQWAARAPRLMSRSEYLYKGDTSGFCDYVPTDGAAEVTTVSKIEANTAAVITALQNGPVMAVVSAISWKSYGKGGWIHKMKDCAYNKDFLHAVVIVGYDLGKDGQDGYWIIRNSWGKDWGDNGHMKLELGNSCGILSDVYQVEALPVLGKDEPTRKAAN